MIFRVPGSSIPNCYELQYQLHEDVMGGFSSPCIAAASKQTEVRFSVHIPSGGPGQLCLRWCGGTNISRVTGFT